MLVVSLKTLKFSLGVKFIITIVDVLTLPRIQNVANTSSIMSELLFRQQI